MGGDNFVLYKVNVGGNGAELGNDTWGCWYAFG